MARSNDPGDDAPREVKLRVLTGSQGPPKTVEEMAASGEIMEAEPKPLAGTGSQMSFDVFADDLSVMRSIMKVKAPTRMVVEGQFQHGDRIKMVVEGIVDDVQFPSIKDKYGNRMGVQRVHVVPVSNWKLVVDDEDGAA